MRISCSRLPHGGGCSQELLTAPSASFPLQQAERSSPKPRAVPWQAGSRLMCTEELRPHCLHPRKRAGLKTGALQTPPAPFPASSPSSLCFQQSRNIFQNQYSRNQPQLQINHRPCCPSAARLLAREEKGKFLTVM